MTMMDTRPRETCRVGSRYIAFWPPIFRRAFWRRRARRCMKRNVSRNAGGVVARVSAEGSRRSARAGIKLKPAVAGNGVEFERLNLIEPLPRRDFQFIFCRNVMIYFDRPHAAGHRARNWRMYRTGRIFVRGPFGNAERLCAPLRYVQPAVYRKDERLPSGGVRESLVGGNLGLQDEQRSGSGADDIRAGLLHRRRGARSGGARRRIAAFMLPEASHRPGQGAAESVHVRRHRHSEAAARGCARAARIAGGWWCGSLGGAADLDGQALFQIGRRNYLAARKLLWKEGLLVAAEVVGGEVSRTVRLEVATGKTWIREGGIEKPRSTVSPRGKESKMAFTVLIVDDSPVMRAFIRARHAGWRGSTRPIIWRPATASRGSAALARESRGRGSYRHQHAAHERRGVSDANYGKAPYSAIVPTLVISTDATHERVNRMLALGAQGYISKPFPPEALREELDRILGAHHVYAE